MPVMTNPGILPSPHFCPNCGNYTQSLDEYTGWCADCSSPPVTFTKIELALAFNAEAIEHYTSSMNVSVWKALRLARQDRPRCIVCGREIHRASRTAIFCRRTAECRRYSRRYVYLYTDKGLDKTQALAQIMSELTGE